MQLAKIEHAFETVVGLVIAERVHLLPNTVTLTDILHAADPATAARTLLEQSVAFIPRHEARFAPPLDQQEVWAAGVTYQRSKVARQEESAGAALFYDRVYSAPRPELFLKATPRRVVPPDHPVRARADSRWSVPEPELTLLINPLGKIVGYTVGNDMSARDIEGENPLYLPQAKIYKQSCSIGPVITLADAMPALPDVVIRLIIERNGGIAYQGSTTLAQMARPLESLVEWLFRENEFPQGVYLLTGTGIVPPDDFTLAAEDRISITITGIGTLTNPVVIG